MDSQSLDQLLLTTSGQKTDRANFSPHRAIK